jgi:hypothetical protein
MKKNNHSIKKDVAGLFMCQILFAVKQAGSFFIMKVAKLFEMPGKLFTLVLMEILGRTPIS